MPLISRKIGSASQILEVFVNDATVSTGAGLANIVASSVTFAWFRSNMAAVSSGTCTTGTLGTFGVSSFVQALSTNALGWYQFCPPDGVFLSGSSAAIHLSLAPSMAPLPILIELTATDNQTAMSSQTISTFLSGSVNASTVADKAGYGVSSVNTGVNVTSVVNSPAVTTAAGIQAVAWDLGRTANLTSTVALTGFSINLATTATFLTTNNDKAGYGVSSVNTGVNVSSVNGSALVTTSPGVITANVTSGVGVSSFAIAVGVSSVADKSGYGVSSVNTGVNVTSVVGTAAVTTQAGIFATVFDLGRTANPNSTVAFSSLSISSQSVSIGAVNVTSVNGSAIVTTSPGMIASAWDLSNILNPTSTVVLSGLTISNVTTVSGGVTVNTNNDKTGYSGSVNVSSMGVNVTTATNLDKTGYATTDFTTALSESYRGVNSTGTPAQLLYELVANITEASNSGTTRTLNSVTSHLPGAVTYGYDSSTSPSLISRTA